MRHHPVLLAAVLVLGVGVASAVAFAMAGTEDRAPESLLPTDSVVYFGWDGTEKHKAEWEKSASYEALDKTHFLRTLTDFGVSFIPADAPVSAESVRQLLEGLGRKGFSVAASFPKAQPIPQVVVVLHQAASLESAFSSAIPKLAGDSVKFETVTLRGRHVTRGTVGATPQAELAWWADGGHLVLAFGPGVVEATLDVADGKSPAISQSANWSKYREEPKDYQAIMAAWCDVAALRARFGDFAMQEKSDKEPKFTVGQLIDLLGGEHLGNVAMRCGLNDRALVSDITIDAPAPRTGILALADQAPITLADLPPLPEGNTGFAAGSFNFGKAYDVILGVVRKIADAATNGGAAKVDEVMKKAPEVLGFDPKADLCDALGHVVCFHSDAAAGIPGGFGFGIAISVEKPELLQKTLKTGFERIQAVSQNAFSAAEEERNGRPVWVFDISNIPLHPAAGLDKHWLFIGLTPQSVESSLLRLDDKLERWKPSAGEQEALNSVPKEFITLSLADPRPLYGTIVGYLPILGSVINQAAESAQKGDRAAKPRGGRGAGKRMALLADIPPAEVLTRPMFPNVSAGTVDAKGIRFQSRDSVPGLAMGGFVAGPVAVALLLPAVQAAREAARRTQSKNNIKQIALALHNYHSVNGSFPAGTYRVSQLKPEKRLSWLTEILPYLEQKPIYDLIDFKKSWDGPANKDAVSTKINLFINPSFGEQKAGGLPVTEYVGLAGVGADGPMLPVTSPKAGVFAYNRVTRIEDIVDGTSNTIMVSECNKDLGSWAAGGRATIRALTQKPYIDGPDGLGGHPEGCQVGFADGSVRFISKTVDPKVLEAMTTIAGGENVGAP
ncbi:MAG TPA: DUF1559 domain-containing protein [Planctomycetaceae bacterium]|jgi:prepilin-type processing-associated H-X9-DG protein|nr:DUF1559 domain-containing protein [Planctomycetaceae bacterium]